MLLVQQEMQHATIGTCTANKMATLKKNVFTLVALDSLVQMLIMRQTPDRKQEINPRYNSKEKIKEKLKT